MVREIITQHSPGASAKKKDSAKDGKKNSTKIVTHEGGNAKNGDYKIPG
jgi:hypothetical protein